MAAFFGVLATMAAWETRAPRRQRTVPRLRRWVGNLGISLVNTLLVRLLFPGVATGVALFAAQRGWGLLHQVPLPFWCAVAGSVVALDFVVYFQHRVFHSVPALWRLHRVHHADLDFDVTTGVRFHPLEIVLSMLIKSAATVVLGAPVLAVVAFEVLLNATSMFNHGNVRLPPALDRILRCLIVTPDMHRVHHSTDAQETNRNFGFNLSLWDRLLGTYKDRPVAGHERMVIGLPDLREPRAVVDLPGMLALPFRSEASGERMNRNGG